MNDCDACNGHTLKIDGKCVLHYVASKHTVDEFEAAKSEVDT